jgi:hypothetical protein
MGKFLGESNFDEARYSKNDENIAPRQPSWRHSGQRHLTECYDECRGDVRRSSERR